MCFDIDPCCHLLTQVVVRLMSNLDPIPYPTLVIFCLSIKNLAKAEYIFTLSAEWFPSKSYHYDLGGCYRLLLRYSERLLKTQTHQTNKELAATNADCSDTSCPLRLVQNVALEHTTKATANGQLSHTF